MLLVIRNINVYNKCKSKQSMSNDNEIDSETTFRMCEVPCCPSYRVIGYVTYVSYCKASLKHLQIT